MKKITEDLEITSIDISMYEKLHGAEITLRFLDEYVAEAMYYENSTGYSFFKTLGNSSKVFESFSAEVEDNENKIIKWVNEQIEAHKLSQS